MRKILIFVLTVAILSAGAEVLFLGFNSIADPASAESVEINYVFRMLLLIAVPIFILVVVGMGYALIFFHRRKTDTGEGHTRRSLPPLEAAWTFIPLLIVIVVSAFGTLMLDEIVKPGQNELEIKVTAQRYVFEFHYVDSNINTFELGLPVNQKVHLTLTSLDVVHDFWIPEFGPKEDCIPGITTELRLTPLQLGDFTVYCSQLCGPGHAYMTAPVTVMSQYDFEAWLIEQKSLPPNALPPITTTTTNN